MSGYLPSDLILCPRFIAAGLAMEHSIERPITDVVLTENLIGSQT
jgi:hypothetical protein